MRRHVQLDDSSNRSHLSGNQTLHRNKHFEEVSGIHAMPRGVYRQPLVARPREVEMVSASLLLALGDRVERLRKRHDALRVDARHGDASVARHVDRVLGCQAVHHLGRDAGEGKHADLVGHMVPRPLGAEVLQVLAQQLAHGDDAVSHALDLHIPLRLEVLAVEDLGHQQRAVQWRVGVHWARNRLHLGLNGRRLLGVVAHNGEAADTLTVQTHVLGVRLAEAHAVPVLDKLADGRGVAFTVAGRKALVCHVEERKVVLLLHRLRDALPLPRRRVHARRVVGACMHQEQAAILRLVDVLEEAFQVEATRDGIVVAVRGRLNASVLPNVEVVAPRWCRDVHLGAWHVALLELCHQTARARARE
mmetsp:Transcript_33703/g.100365  ORF Transcript_33703/g.100365 Transcript_33703/m.100365 type:complete len:362 (+) Transcript_33703:59-1144(+)